MQWKKNILSAHLAKVCLVDNTSSKFRDKWEVPSLSRNVIHFKIEKQTNITNSLSIAPAEKSGIAAVSIFVIIWL